MPELQENIGGQGDNQGANQNNDHSNIENQGADVEVPFSSKGTLDFLSQGKTGEEFQKEFNELMDARKGQGQNNNQDQQLKAEADKAAADKLAAEKVEAGNKPAETKKVNEIETPLFGKQELGKKKPEEKPVEFKEFSEIQDYVKANYGIEDVNKFITESVPKFREQAQKMGEYEKKVNEFTKIFENIPEPLFNAVKSHLEGRSWKEEIEKAPKLDFNKKVDDHDKNKLIETYFPGKFSKDDFDSEEEGNKKILEIAYDAAKRSYEADKTSFDGKLQARIQIGRAHV